MGEYNIEEAARLSGITVRSLRNYVHQYGEFMSLKRSTYNALVFCDDDLTTLVKVKALLRDGKTRPQIAEALSAERTQPTIQVTRSDVPSAPDAPVILPLLKKIDEVLTQLLDENRRLHERLQELEQRVVDTATRHLAAPAMVALPPARTNGIDSRLDLPVPSFFLHTKDGLAAVVIALYDVFLRGGRYRR